MRKQDLEDMFKQGYERHYRTRYYFKQRRTLKTLYMKRRLSYEDERTRMLYVTLPSGKRSPLRHQVNPQDLHSTEASGFDTEWLLDPDTSCYKSLDVVKLWSEKCNDKHFKCINLWNCKSSLPSLLLYLGSSSSTALQLCEHPPEGSKYASLSHVCGGTVPSRLLSRN